MLTDLLLSSYGEIIKYHRKKSGLSRNALAEIAEVGKTAVFDAEHSKSTLQLATLIKILNALNITITFQSPLIKEYEELNRGSE